MIVNRSIVPPLHRSPEKDEVAAHALLDRLACFALAHGGRWCFVDWPWETLRAYLEFHIRQGTFAFVQTFVQDGRQIVGLAVAWRDRLATVRARAARGEVIFRWQPEDPAGDCVFVAEVLATVPGALGSVIAGLARAHPAWRGLPAFTCRENQLIQYPMDVVKHFTKGKG